MLRLSVNDDASAELTLDLDAIYRAGAHRMLGAAVDAEVDASTAGLADEVDDDGRRFVVRNGYARPRMLATGAELIEVAAPRVNDKRVNDLGKRCRFSSKILDPWCRKRPKVS